MPAANEKIRVYRELAEIYDGQGQAQMRDRFLVLAADTALAAGQAEDAERLRAHLLRLNPHHLLKPYDSFAEAAKSADVENYLSALRRSHPYERTEHLLETLRQGGTPSKRESVAGDEGATRGSVPDLQVFRVVDVGETPRADPSRSRSVNLEPSASRARPSKPAGSPAPASQPKRPPNVPSVYAMRQDHPASSDKVGFEVVDDGRVGGAWISTGLAVLALIGGIVLAVYTLARPFVPRQWLP